MALGIIVCGAGGRMGGALVRAVAQSGDYRLVGAIDKPGSARLGKDAGESSGAGHLGLAVTDRIDAVLKSSSVIIDFTNPAASLQFLRSAAKTRTPIVIATTAATPSPVARSVRRNGLPSASRVYMACTMCWDWSEFPNTYRNRRLSSAIHAGDLTTPWRHIYFFVIFSNPAILVET
jgi:saccharopine dehydrogenase-like NADP-dependent oxidoreductase